MNFTEHVACPACKADDGTPVRSSRDIVQCGACSLVYLRTRPPVSELELWYQKYASNPGSHMRLPDTIAQLKTTALRRNDIMSDILAFTGDNRGRFLDIGSGYGAFLLNAREHGFLVNGIEICRQMAEFATNLLGIYTHSKQLEDCDFSSESMRVVSLCHSLEHLPNTATALGFIHRILEPGGLICGIVPNFASWGSTTMGDRWPWIDADYHYSHFTAETLRSTFWRYGFNVQKMYTATGDFDRKLLPPALTAVQKFEQEGKGEELRWFAVKI